MLQFACLKNEMNGQTVLITGAAGGIGRATGELLGTSIEMNNFSERVLKPLLARISAKLNEGAHRVRDLTEGVGAYTATDGETRAGA